METRTQKLERKLCIQCLHQVTFIPKITLMIQSMMTQTMRIIYLYRLFKKDLMQCLWESPICGRTRILKCLHKERVIKCKTQRELWDLDCPQN